MSRTDSPTGAHELLGEREDVAVSRCPHGCLHLRVGAVSLRMAPEQWRRFVEVCVEAEIRREVRHAVARGVPPH